MTWRGPGAARLPFYVFSSLFAFSIVQYAYCIIAYFFLLFYSHSILSYFSPVFDYIYIFCRDPMFSSFNSQVQEPQRNYIPRKPSRNDLEAGTQNIVGPLPTRSGGGRLKKGIRNLEHDFNHLERKTNVELSDNLFWYQEFSARSSTAFRFSKSDTFATCLIKLRSTLKQTAKSSPTSHLQLW